MHNDNLVTISVGKSRMEKHWQNKELQWSAFIDRLRTTHRTNETYKQYISAKPAKQEVIKDIGGFVGGHITGGRRKNGSISHRSIISLDIDFAGMDFWENSQIIMTHGSCLYSTHKHCSDQPRFRWLLPLSRPVSADEYEAIARKIAWWCGIELFDPTTFQPTRLMYWPSTSADGEYVFEELDAPWINADAVLRTYDNWQDTTQWPMHAGMEEDVKRDIKQQGDPLEKPGLIGALCRAYTIQEVIEKYLNDVYSSGGSDDRYSYALGSTANGLVIYDDKFAYSHHATDPVGGKLCNAWDLVRLHKFGSLDVRAREDTKPQNMPSFKAMADMISEDGLVKRILGSERMAAAKEIFFNESAEVSLKDFDALVDAEDWLEALEIDRSGNYVSTIDNIKLILENDPGLRGCIAYNAFTNRGVMMKDLPWRKRDLHFDHLKDSDDASLRHYMESIYGITGIQKITDAIAIVLHKNSFHPVRDYIDSLDWDGLRRVDSLFIDYMGAEDNEYTRAVTRKTLVAAVSRVYEPGIKFDSMPVLIGEQGLGKSTLINKLGMKWYSDSFMGVQDVRALEQLQGVWIMEVAELSGFKKAEVESIKHFMSKQVDEYRIAYGKIKEVFPRQGIFIGTTQEVNFLKDYTGNRRFWPVLTDIKMARLNVFKELGRKVVDQVWAEAYLMYLAGEDLYLDKAVEVIAKEVQAEHMEIEIRIGIIQKYLDTFVPVSWKEKTIYERRAWLQAEKEDITEAGTMIRKQVSVAEIYCECFNGVMKDLTSWIGRDLNNVMSRVSGWKKTGKMVSQNLYGRQYVYERQGLIE